MFLFKRCQCSNWPSMCSRHLVWDSQYDTQLREPLNQGYAVITSWPDNLCNSLLCGKWKYTIAFLKCIFPFNHTGTLIMRQIFLRQWVIKNEHKERSGWKCVVPPWGRSCQKQQHLWANAPEYSMTADLETVQRPNRTDNIRRQVKPPSTR